MSSARLSARGVRSGLVTGAVGMVTLTALAACGGGAGTTSASGPDAVITIAAIEPLSGAFATSGKDELAGAKFAVQQINAAGGIKSLGGAKLKIVSGDAGTTPAQATATAQTVLSKPGISAALGCWFSSLSLAATAVGELNKIPWLTASASDQIVAKNPKYVFKVSSPLGEGTKGLQYLIQHYFTKNGQPPLLAIAGDNNVANTQFYQQYKSWDGQGIARIGVQKIWTPPLADATPVASAVVSGRPDLIVLGATSTSDETELLQALKSLGNTAPLVGTASSWDNPSYLQTVGGPAMERIITPDGLPFPGKGSEATTAAYQKFSGEPWMDSEAASAYSNVEILAQAIEQAKSSKPADIATALHKLHLVDFKPLAGMFPGWNDVSFQANGQRKGGSFVLTEWLNGVPKNVYPPDLAVAEADLGGAS